MDQKKNIVVATDGSQQAKQAFYQACQFFEYQNGMFDKIVVAHVSDPQKTYLPFEFLSTTIQQDYETELISRYPEANYSVVFQEKEQNQEYARNQILKIAQNFSAAFLIVGFNGRKGVKRDVTILGQTVRNSAYHSSIPVMIVKKLYERGPNYGLKFVACVDGSKKSYKCLDAVIQLSFDQRDSIIVVFAPTPDSEHFGTKIKQAVQDHMSQFQRKWEYKQLSCNYDNVSQIVSLINNSDDLDFVAFGNNGYRAQLELKNYFGNTADKLLKEAKANVLIVP